MSIQSTQKPHQLHSPDQVVVHRVAHPCQMAGAPKPLHFVSPTRLTNSVQKQQDAVSRTLDFKSHLSPMTQLKEINNRQQPTIQPISSQHISFKSHYSKLCESQVSSTMSLESLTQQLERRSYKENIKSLDNAPSLTHTIKELESQVRNSPMLFRLVQSLQSALQRHTDQLQAEIALGKHNQQEYVKLRPIMDSLQQKLTVLVDENSKLTSYNTSLKRQQDSMESLRTQLLNMTTSKDDIVKRFTIEREMLETQRDQLIKQLQEDTNTRRHHNTSSSSSSLMQGGGAATRETAFKLEQAEVKLLTLQIANDNLNQELQHKLLDLRTIDNLKDKIQILETKIQELIYEKEIISVDNDQSKQDLEDKAQEYRKLQQHVYDAKVAQQSKLDQKDSDLQSLQITLTQRISEHNRDRTNFENESRCVQQSLVKECQLKAELEYERIKLKEQLQRVAQTSQIISSELQASKQKYQIVNAEIQDMKDRWQTRWQVEESATKQVAQLESKISALSERSAQHEHTIMQMEQVMDSKCLTAQNEFNRVLQHKNEVSSQLQLERDDMKRKMDNQNHECHKKQQELVDRTEEARTFKRKYNETLTNLDMVERKLLEKMEYELRSVDTQSNY